jgi:hypothetical protein
MFVTLDPKSFAFGLTLYDIVFNRRFLRFVFLVFEYAKVVGIHLLLEDYHVENSRSLVTPGNE